MKKNVLSIGTALMVLGAVFTSCTTTKVTTTTKQNEIKSEKMIINTLFEKGDFAILGNVTGESDYVYFDNDTKSFVGDSQCYGFIPEPDSVVVDKNYAVSIGKKKTTYANTAIEIAKQNAYYNLIQKAYDMGADSILEPTVTIETINEDEVSATMRKPVKTQYKVTVRAKAIQIKNK